MEYSVNIISRSSGRFNLVVNETLTHLHSNNKNQYFFYLRLKKSSSLRSAGGVAERLKAAVC